MKHINVAIVSESDIIIDGLTSIISTIKDVSPIISELTDTDIESHDIGKYSIIIADANSIDSSTIEAIRTFKTVQIIGIYLGALPIAKAKLFDSTISIYDSAPTIKERLIQAFAVKEETNAQNNLTSREKEIVVGIVKGLSNKEIAAMINVSVNTVMTHRRNIASKLQIHSPAGLTIYAIVSKLVTLDEVKSSIE